MNTTEFARQIRSALDCTLAAVAAGVDTEPGRKWLDCADTRVGLAEKAKARGSRAEHDVLWHTRWMVADLRLPAIV